MLSRICAAKAIGCRLLLGSARLLGATALVRCRCRTNGMCWKTAMPTVLSWLPGQVVATALFNADRFYRVMSPEGPEEAARAFKNVAQAWLTQRRSVSRLYGYLLAGQVGAYSDLRLRHHSPHHVICIAALSLFRLEPLVSLHTLLELA